MNAPIIKRTYYAVADLDVDGVDVAILLPSGGELVARRKRITRRGQRTAIIWRVRDIVREPGRPTRHVYRDLPRHIEVTRWRPIDRATFPGLLPASPARIEGDVAWQSPVEPPVPAEQQDELHWPGPYSEAPNISLREAEVRVLRGLRTERCRSERIGNAGPAGFMDSIIAVVRNAGHHLVPEHVDPTHIGAVGVGWEPTRQDRGDWLVGLSWFVQLSHAQREIVVLRSLDPPYSFAQIGSRQNPPKSHEWARQRYKAAIRRAAAIANSLVTRLTKLDTVK